MLTFAVTDMRNFLPGLRTSCIYMEQDCANRSKTVNTLAHVDSSQEND